MEKRDLKYEALIEKPKLLKNGLIAVAIDSGFDADDEYRELREEIIKYPRIINVVVFRVPLQEL